MEEIIRFIGSTKEYRKGRGLFDVNFSLYKGEILGLYGIRGSKKSTILRQFLKQLKADGRQDGDVILLEDPFASLDKEKRLAYIENIIYLNSIGKTICISSESFEELEGICHRIVFIHNGKHVNTVYKSSFDADKERLYRVGFHKAEEYASFIRTCTYDLINKNNQYNSLVLKVDVELLYILFKELKMYDIRKMEFVPYSYNFKYCYIMKDDLTLESKI